MEIRYNVTGSERKRLVQTIAKTLEVKAKYLGMPSMAYEIDTYTVDKDGTLSFSDRNDTEEVERLLEAVFAEGFKCEPHERFSGETDAARVKNAARERCPRRIAGFQSPVFLLKSRKRKKTALYGGERR